MFIFSKIFFKLLFEAMEGINLKFNSFLKIGTFKYKTCQLSDKNRKKFYNNGYMTTLLHEIPKLEIYG